MATAERHAAEDLPFRHYTVKHRITSWISVHLFDRLTYRVRHGLLTGMRRRGGLGWLPAALAGSSVTAEQRFWESLDLDGLTVYDVGAFHGLLTMFFVKAGAKAVVSFEPNSGNHRRLMENLALNGIRNVTVRKVGIGSCQETRGMVAMPLMMGGASVDGATSEGLLRSGARTITEQISITTLDHEAEAGLPAPDFIKIDIEGWELEALRGARNTLARYKPVLFLEMHGETIREKRRKVAEIVGFLRDAGYHSIRHIETGTEIGPENASVAQEGHLYCRA